MQFNKFGNYKYRSCEDIIEAVKPILADLDYYLIISDEVVTVGDRFYVKATVRITNGEEVYESIAFAREEESKKGMDGSQITGAASSYARKYALNGLLAIDDSKDSDVTNERISYEQERQIEYLLSNSTISEEEREKIEKKMHEFTPDKAKSCIDYLHRNQQSDPVSAGKNLRQKDIDAKLNEVMADERK